MSRPWSPLKDQRDYRSALAKPPRDAEGVAYTVRAETGELKFFDCAPLKATLTQRGCASRWREAQEATGHAAERLIGCRGCPIGAAHAGEDHVRYSRHYDTMYCPGCRKGTTRMINNRVCVSCYNRRREMRVGLNRRGHLPVELLKRPLHLVDFELSVDGQARTADPGEGVDLLEALLQTLRTTKGAVVFGFKRQLPCRAIVHHLEAA